MTTSAIAPREVEPAGVQRVAARSIVLLVIGVPFYAPLIAFALTNLGAPSGIGHGVRNIFFVEAVCCTAVSAFCWWLGRMKDARWIAAIAAISLLTAFALPWALGIKNTSLSDPFTTSAATPTH